MFLLPVVRSFLPRTFLSLTQVPSQINSLEGEFPATKPLLEAASQCGIRCKFLHVATSCTLTTAGTGQAFPHAEPLRLLSNRATTEYLDLHSVYEGFASMFRKTIYGTTFKDVDFVPLQSATFCIQCELISSNSRPYCLACGNTTLLSLSRVLGGSLRQQQTAHLITDSELDSLVRDLLRTVPDPLVNREVASIADYQTRVPSTALRSQLRVANGAHPVSGFRAVRPGEEVDIHAGQLDLEPAISAITERAQHLTGATGAAIALSTGNEIVCRAR